MAPSGLLLRRRCLCTRQISCGLRNRKARKRIMVAMVNSNRTVHVGGWYSARPLYSYIWRTSRRSQIGACLLITFITPLPMLSLEFQRRIVDDAVGAHNIRLLIALGVGYAAVVCLRLLLK